jgi:hypothetical protein
VFIIIKRARKVLIKFTPIKLRDLELNALKGLMDGAEKTRVSFYVFLPIAKLYS